MLDKVFENVIVRTGKSLNTLNSHFLFTKSFKCNTEKLKQHTE